MNRKRKDKVKIKGVFAHADLSSKGPINYNKLIKKSQWNWQIKNESKSPFFSTRVPINSRRQSTILLFKTGNFQILGTKSKKEATEIYHLVLEEFVKLKIFGRARLR